ncbi:hypothetical protein AB0H37_33735 [Actinomadura sp. NPDC023710]|uniref:hypothetical protein n=1 Tax=Actinomadura sp. NPDC023710 TaxID=3158219 RepID=UPI0033C431EA
MDVPMYAIPQTGQRLGVQPRLASWDATGHPSQIRLKKFLSEAEKMYRPQLNQLPDPLALRLDVGLTGTTPLLDQHDLDNYLFPLSTRLSRATGRAFASVWGIKRHSPDSRLGVTTAIPLQADGRPQVFDVRTTASSGTTAFKQQIDQQLTRAHVFPDGPLQLHIGFVVGPRRHWPNLWKPTIDALGKILGRTAPNRPWHPLDGRIVQLGLSTRTDPNIGDHVALRINARPADTPTTP